MDRLFNRGQLLDDMLRLERLLDEFRVNFSVRIAGVPIQRETEKRPQDKTLVRLEIHMNTLLGRAPGGGSANLDSPHCYGS